MAAWFLTPWLEPLARCAALVLTACAALLAGGCNEKPVPEGHERVVIDGRTFILEVAADDERRVRGLGGRSEIPEDGGMLFVFRRPEALGFVMRDCLVPIDIIFLDATGRVTAMHQMTLEEPRRPDEKPYADALGRRRDPYEERLKIYRSNGPAQFAIELRGGMLDELSVSVGDRIPLETERLGQAAR